MADSLLKATADALVQCIKSDLIDTSAVVNWATLVLGAQPDSHYSICDLAGADAWSLDRVVTGLLAVPGVSDETEAKHLFWAFVEDAWDAGELGLGEVSWTLCQRGIHAIDYPDATKWRGCFSDDFDHGEARMDGEPRDRLIKEMRKAIQHLAGDARWAARPPASWSGPQFDVRGDWISR